MKVWHFCCNFNDNNLAHDVLADIRERIAQNVETFLDRPAPPSRKGMSDLPEDVSSTKIVTFQHLHHNHSTIYPCLPLHVVDLMCSCRY